MGSAGNTFEGTHKVTWRGERTTAKCSVAGLGTNVDLDYGATPAITDFNRQHGIIIGTMRIVFESPKRQTISEILWRAEGQKRFNHTATLVDPSDPNALPDVDAMEGWQKLVPHLRRERNQTLIRKKKEAVFPNFACEACKFDFKTAYGELGSEYCEVHHNIPLGQGVRLEANVAAQRAPVRG